MVLFPSFAQHADYVLMENVDVCYKPQAADARPDVIEDGRPLHNFSYGAII